MNAIHADTRMPGLVRSSMGIATLLALLAPAASLAAIDGEMGTNFSLTATDGFISMPDGASIYSWGYTAGNDMQLPGPTLIVTEGDIIEVTLTNALPPAAGNVSIVFPGLDVTSTSGGVAGALTREAQPGGSVTYTFTATDPGTYQYHSGTRPDLQVEMGLYGALIVEPATPAVGCMESAYDHPATCFDREYLFVLSEVDIDVHNAAENQASGSGPINVGSGPFFPEYWLINGRAAPDTMKDAGTALLPTQPYNSMPMMHPGDRVLTRIVGAGRDSHPFHTHGNHIQVLAQDARLILSETDSTKLAGPKLFTVPSAPGSTVDGIFEWTGEELGWDIYGHAESDPLEPGEYAPDHGKPIPVELPDLGVLAFGGFYSGSPFLGYLGSLPPDEGGLNPEAGFTYMWHSHNEREMVNNDVFPGGMMTMMLVLPPWVDLDMMP
jgi:manganese oxidase